MRLAGAETISVCREYGQEIIWSREDKPPTLRGEGFEHSCTPRTRLAPGGG